MRIAYFDCFNGAAGDMIVGALLDAGADPESLRGVIAGLRVTGYDLTIEKVRKQGFAATRFFVRMHDDHGQPHRHLSHILRILDAAELTDAVRESAKAVFRRLATAEAHVHGTTLDKVHFHEVGAVDALIDIVSACHCVHSLHIDRVVCSAIPLGGGTTTCSHGVMPVPAPATAELLKGAPIAATDELGELTTPTGAALLTTLANSFGPIPAMRVDHVGQGAGERDGQRRPNIFRVIIGETVAAPACSDEITVLETNLDDCPPAAVAYCVERLFAEGALEAFTTSIMMKKSRPGVVLTALCRPEDADRLCAILFVETTTLGVRRHLCTRSLLLRKEHVVETPFGRIRVKEAQRGGERTCSPEFDDCRAAAQKHSAPLSRVVQSAIDAWRSV